MSLPPLLLEPLIRAALQEDLGRAGDITTMAVIPEDARFTGAIVARQAGTIAGLEAAAQSFSLLDPTVETAALVAEGARVGPNTPVLRVSGPARSILSSERVALNLICHLSGIATATATLVDAVADYPVRITCTRKTTPGLRMLEKAAVLAGGGSSHRYGLDDAVLIKDNHIAVAGGIAEAIRRARAAVGHLVKVEVEADTLEQVRLALPEGPDVILLDNMDLETMAEAVRLIDKRALAEASGGITLERVRDIAATGVDVISSGALTHSVTALDLGLDEGV